MRGYIVSHTQSEKLDLASYIPLLGKFFKSSKSCTHTGKPFALSYEKGAVEGEIVLDRLSIGEIVVPQANIGSAKQAEKVAVSKSEWVHNRWEYRSCVSFDSCRIFWRYIAAVLYLRCIA